MLDYEHRKNERDAKMSVTRYVYKEESWKYPKEEQGAFVTEYEGAVLKLSSGPWQVMSDIWGTQWWALVWDGNAAKQVVYQHTEGGPQGKANVDATPEVVEAYRAWLVQKYYNENVRRQQEAAEKPEKGKVVRVVSRRNGQGGVGKVEVYLPIWVWERNVVVENPAQYLDLNEAMERAKNRADAEVASK